MEVAAHKGRINHFSRSAGRIGPGADNATELCEGFADASGVAFVFINV